MLDVLSRLLNGDKPTIFRLITVINYHFDSVSTEKIKLSELYLGLVELSGIRGINFCQCLRTSASVAGGH